MKIAHVTDCYLPRLGGIEMQVNDLAVRQAANGHEVAVVTSVAGGPDSAGGVVVRRPPTSRPRDDGAIRYARSFGGRSAVLAGGYDVVHVHASTFSPLAFLAARAASRAGIATAVTAHSLWSYAGGLFGAADRLCRWGDWPVAWSAVSTVAADQLRGVLDGRAAVAVLPNGIDPSRWSGPREEPGADLRLITVMRLARRKRPGPLLAMLRQAAQRLGPSARLSAEIIGDGPRRPALERYVRRHDMTGWVTLAGRRTRTQIRQALAGADIFIAPSALESFGIAALEARCAGLPVVARAGTGVEDFIADGREGMLADSDASMVDAIVALVASSALRARIRAHNQSVAPRVTWDAVLAGCDALYERAFSLRQGGPARPARPAPLALEATETVPR